MAWTPSGETLLQARQDLGVLREAGILAPSEDNSIEVTIESVTATEPAVAVCDPRGYGPDICNDGSPLRVERERVGSSLVLTFHRDYRYTIPYLIVEVFRATSGRLRARLYAMDLGLAVPPALEVAACTLDGALTRGPSGRLTLMPGSIDSPETAHGHLEAQVLVALDGAAAFPVSIDVAF